MSDVAQLVKWVRKVSMRLESGAPGITERSAMSVTARLSADALTEQAAEIDRLREALNGLACEVAGLKSFDAGMRDVIGNSNWSCLRGKLEAARAALHKEPTS